MGYNTRYELKFEPLTIANKDCISHLVAENEEAAWVIDEDGNSEDYSKWYDHDIDMKAFSLKYPDTVFILSGSGEEDEDIWVKYFKNGKMQEEYAEIVIAKYDENKLQ